MTRKDGLVEQNLATGEVERVSQRGQDFSLKAEKAAQESFAPDRALPGNPAGRRQQRLPASPTPEPQTELLPDSTAMPEQEALPESQPLSIRQNEIPIRPGEATLREGEFGPAPIRRPRKPGAIRTARDAPVSRRPRLSQDAPRPDMRERLEKQPSIPHNEPEREDAPFIAQDERVQENAVSVSPETPSEVSMERPGRLRFEKDAPRSGSVRENVQRGTSYYKKFAAKAGTPQTPVERPVSDANTSAADFRFDPAAAEVPSPPADVAHPANQREQDAPLRFRDDPQPERDSVPPKSSRLRFAPDERPPDPARPRGDAAQTGTDSSIPKAVEKKKITRARTRAEQAGQKLTAAEGKLPTQRVKHVDRVFDPATGKVQKRLRFETEVKSQREHVRGPLPLRPVKVVTRTGSRWVHKKMYEVEHENVGVEAAHKGEMAVEGAARMISYSNKTRPYRRVSNLRRQTERARFKLEWKQTLEANPGLKRNPLAKMAQKRRIKRQYQNARRSAGLARRAAQSAAQAAKALVAAIRSHPAVAGTVVGIVLLLIIFASAFSSCASLTVGSLSAALASSYTAADTEIDDAELAYRQWEHELRMEIEEVESTRIGYDEYNFDLGEIGHDPFELMAYLTAKYDDFTFTEVEAELREIFGEQYVLEYDEEVETRYRDPGDSDGDGDREPYEWRILNVKLTVTPLGDVLAGRIGEEEQDRYDTLMDSHGNRQYIISPFAFDWLPYISEYYGARIHPVTGAEDFHTGVDIAVAAGTEILAGHDGVVASAGSAGDYGLAIVIAGENGVSSRYAHCSQLLVSAGQTVKKGDVIARVGSTGMSTGPHLHLEVIVEGRQLNPLYFAEEAPRENEQE